jgi:DNA-binding transcriptional ArsR family regulator
VRLAQRRAVDFATTAISRFGIPVGDQWLIPLSQAHLATQMGWSANSGTMAAYLNALGPAVRQRQGGIVLDAQLLADLGRRLAPPSTTTARTDQIARDLAMRLGHPTPTGTVIMAGTTPEAQPASIADMAAHLGLHRSTVHRHLQRLRAAGRLCCRQGVWTFPPSPEPSPPPPGVLSGKVGSPVSQHDRPPEGADQGPGGTIGTGLQEELETLRRQLQSLEDLVRTGGPT